jgi:hypothetical protein
MRRAPVLIALGMASVLAFTVAPASAQHRGGGGGGGRAAGGHVGGGMASPRGSFAVRGGSVAGVRSGSFARVGGFNRGVAVAPRSNFAVRGGFVGSPRFVGGSRFVGGGRFVGGARFVAPVRFFRPYYSFRPHFGLGFGLFVGYPVAWGYPYYYPYSYYPSAYPYPYPYAYDDQYPYPYAAAPAPSYSAPSQYSSTYPPAAQNSVGVQQSVPQSVQANTGGLSFEITPNEARVIVDGHDVGTVGQFTSTSEPLGLPAGRHHVEIVANGYRTMSSDVDVVAGQVIPFQGAMER